MKQNYIKVKSIEHLKELVEEKEKFDYFIQLNYGLRSSKTITMSDDGRHFEIENGIDGSRQRLLPKSLNNKKCTNIGEAISKGAFWCYD